MAEDMQERARRVKSLLSSYYGTATTDGEEDGNDFADSYAPGWQRSSPLRSDINSKGFDHEQYVSKQIRDSRLDELLQQHVAWSAEIKNLDSDMQMLVYENYNKFISATDTIRRMKDNVAGMESSMEKLLETVTAVQAKSDGVNASLGERRDHIEQLNGTRSLLRKVQFIFDLPKRLSKFAKELDYESAVRAYVGALPVLEGYGSSSFQSCREEAADVMDSVTRKLQERVMSGEATAHERSEAAVLLQELNEPVEKLMDEYLAAHWDRLLEALRGNSPTFLEEFERTTTAFREVFPMGEERLTEATKEIFNEYFAMVQRAFTKEDGSGPPAADLIAILKQLSRDVVSMHHLVPGAQLPERAAQAVETTVSEHVVKGFSHLGSQVTGALTAVARPSTRGGALGSLGPKPLQAVLEAAHRSLVQGSLHLLKDLAELLDDSVELLREWRGELVDLVQAEFQSLFTSLNDHFLALCARTTPEPLSTGAEAAVVERGPVGAQGPVPGLVLLLARLAQSLQQTAVPRVSEVLTRSFYGGTARGMGESPAFEPERICRQLHATAEQLLQQYVNAQARKLSLMVRKSTATPNWLKHKEPRDVRMVADLLLQEVDAMEDDVEQLLPPGADRSLAYRHLKHSKEGPSVVGRTGSFREGGRGGEAKGSSRARSRLLERDVAKLFSQRVELFTKLEFTQTWVVSTVVKMCLKAIQECVRLQTFGRSGYQQMQLDMHFLRDPLHSYVDDESVVDSLLDEVCAAAGERCLDPVPMEPAVMDRIIQAKRSKSAA